MAEEGAATLLASWSLDKIDSVTELEDLGTAVERLISEIEAVCKQVFMQEDLSGEILGAQESSAGFDDC